MLEPLRWCWFLRPTWLALEQVPGVLPLWRTFGRVLREWGFNVWVGVLNAADFGVPQVRRRAILMAKRGRKDWLAPTPTHSRSGGGGRRRWVTMAEALGWGLERCDDVTGWAWRRPATTVACDSRVFRPGGHRANDGRAEAPGRSEGAIRVEPWEALVLQGFPAEFPVCGSRMAVFRQIGNAVPPRLAAAVAGALTAQL